MTDTQILDLLDTLPELPKLTDGRQQYVHVPAAGNRRAAVLECHRIGAGERWSFGPSRDVHRVDWIPDHWPRHVRAWIDRAERLDFAAHARAMSARTL